MLIPYGLILSNTTHENDENVGMAMNPKFPLLAAFGKYSIKLFETINLYEVGSYEFANFTVEAEKKVIIWNNNGEMLLIKTNDYEVTLFIVEKITESTSRYSIFNYLPLTSTNENEYKLNPKVTLSLYKYGNITSISTSLKRIYIGTEQGIFKVYNWKGYFLNTITVQTQKIEKHFVEDNDNYIVLMGNSNLYSLLPSSDHKEILEDPKLELLYEGIRVFHIDKKSNLLIYVNNKNEIKIYNIIFQDDLYFTLNLTIDIAAELSIEMTITDIKYNLKGEMIYMRFSNNNFLLINTDLNILFKSEDTDYKLSDQCEFNDTDFILSHNKNIFLIPTIYYNNILSYTVML